MKMRITVDGRAYEVDVEILEDARTPGATLPAATGPAPLPTPSPGAPPPRPAAPAAPAGPGDAKEVRSPIAGTVVRVLVKVGDDVKPDQTLMVVEAMKMESNIASPLSGTVKEIGVAQGATVGAGDVLIRFN
ncbi:MAG: biotin/lipoyl-containing protein [Planctomycetota bacterium]